MSPFHSGRDAYISITLNCKGKRWIGAARNWEWNQSFPQCNSSGFCERHTCGNFPCESHCLTGNYTRGNQKTDLLMFVYPHNNPFALVDVNHSQLQWTGTRIEEQALSQTACTPEQCLVCSSHLDTEQASWCHLARGCPGVQPCPCGAAGAAGRLGPVWTCRGRVWTHRDHPCTLRQTKHPAQTGNLFHLNSGVLKHHIPGTKE